MVFDGSAWSNATGISGVLFNKMRAFGGKLYAAGLTCGYTSSKGVVYSFNGSQWKEEYREYAGTASSFSDLTEFEGKLYAAGGSSSNGGSVLALEGGSWGKVSSFPNGVYTVLSLGVFNGRLYAGTNNNGIAYYLDKNSWKKAFDSDDYAITSLAAFRGKLYAGTSPNGMVQAFDGASLGDSLTSSGLLTVLALENFDGKLYAGGSIDSRNIGMGTSLHVLECSG